METTLIIVLILMIAGAIHALHARDLLSAIVSYGVVGYSLVIGFLVLKAPDLAIVQIVVETIALIIMISVLIISTREDLEKRDTIVVRGQSYVNVRNLAYIFFALVAGFLLAYFFNQVIAGLEPLGVHHTRMATEYIEKGVEATGSVNLVTGVLLDYRAFDTLGEATILFTAVMGVLAILRLKTHKK